MGSARATAAGVSTVRSTTRQECPSRFGRSFCTEGAFVPSFNHGVDNRIKRWKQAGRWTFLAFVLTQFRITFACGIASWSVLRVLNCAFFPFKTAQQVPGIKNDNRNRCSIPCIMRASLSTPRGGSISVNNILYVFVCPHVTVRPLDHVHA